MTLIERYVHVPCVVHCLYCTHAVTSFTGFLQHRCYLGYSLNILACFPYALFAVPPFSSCWLIFGANSTVLNSRIFSTRRHAVLHVTIIISLNILIHQVPEVTGISFFLHVASRGTGFNWPMAVAMETRNPHKKCLGHLRH